MDSGMGRRDVSGWGWKRGGNAPRIDDVGTVGIYIPLMAVVAYTAFLIGLSSYQVFSR